jgi:coenzyme F420-reducing hydrogenase beta subunit/polysaccharide pyruvyl transferase WcaK-like protein
LYANLKTAGGVITIDQIALPRGLPGIRVAVIGGTFAGNKGAAAMLESAVVNLDERMGGRLRFDVISVYPRRDRSRKLPENIRIVSGTPVKLVLILPPLALLYAVLGKLRLPRGFLLAFRPLRAIVRAAAILDVSGISYVDGRGATLAYNIACNLPAILVGTPIVKLSQAIGPFRSLPNRMAARLVLSRISAIFARGRETSENLRKLGLENVFPAADLAFILNEHVPVPELSGNRYRELSGEEIVVGVIPSQVLAGYCEKRGIDLVATLASSLDKIHEETGARIAIIAHSLLEPEKHSRNNDYHICAALYRSLKHKDRAVLIAEDLTASELRSVIGRCNCLIAARFHGMISALCVGVPTLVLAWSHKYKEVMADFGLEDCILEIDGLSAASLLGGTKRILAETERIRAAITASLPAVMKSARTQIDYTAEMLGGITGEIAAGTTARRLYERFYADRIRKVYLGYGANPAIREGSASGGLVTSLIINQLNAGRITGAIECRTDIENGRLEFRTLVCSTPEEALDCRTSIYSDFDHAQDVRRLLEEREGTFAIVALPCQWKTINRFVEAHPKLREKVGLRIGLWCGHATDRRLIDDFLRLKGIDPREIKRFFYRKGLWRGETVVELANGETKRIPFQAGYGLLQNLYVDCKTRCFSCTDHFCEGADISFGDAWLAQLKWADVKHSMTIAFTDRGLAAINDLVDRGDARLAETAPELAVQSQKRAVIWHTFGNAGRSRVGRLFGMHIPDRSGCRPRWNDFASALLILAVHRSYASALRGPLLRLPWRFLFPYMLAQKAFLNS